MRNGFVAASFTTDSKSSTASKFPGVRIQVFTACLVASFAAVYLVELPMGSNVAPYTLIPAACAWVTIEAYALVIVVTEACSYDISLMPSSRIRYPTFGLVSTSSVNRCTPDGPALSDDTTRFEPIPMLI